MKPIERSGYIDIWVLVHQGADGKFYFNSTALTAPFGAGFFSTEKEAQHQQTLELLKGNRCELFHLEYPIK